MKRKRSARGVGITAGALLLSVMLAACENESGGSPSAPSTSPSSSVYQVRLTAVALDPFQLEIPVGARVRFVNEGLFARQIGSACPEIEAVGLLQPGNSRDSGIFASAKTCSYFDRLNPAQVLFQGTIIVR